MRELRPEAPQLELTTTSGYIGGIHALIQNIY